MDNQRLKISVIVPVYNTREYLKACLDSIISQTLKEIEIILVDDGSDDVFTLALMDEYLKKDKRIRLVRKENGGQSSARNKGLLHASGKYVAFIDHDDIVNAHMYEVLYLEAERTHSDFVECGFGLVRDSNLDKVDLKKRPGGAPAIQHTVKDHKDWLIDHIHIWNRIYRNDFLKKNNLEFDDVLWEEDVIFSFKALISAESFSFLDEILYFHIEHEANTTRQLGRKIFDSFKSQDLLRDFLYQKGCFDEFEDQYNIRVLKNILFALKTVHESLEEEFFMRANQKIMGIPLKKYSHYYSSSKRKLLAHIQKGDFKTYQRYYALREKRKYILRNMFKIKYTKHEKSFTLLGLKWGGLN